MTRHEVTLRFTNGAPNHLRFVLEPWGDVYNFPPGTEMAVHFSADRAGEPEVVVGDGAIEVYGWTGCIVDILQDGTEPEQVDTTLSSGWTPTSTTSPKQKPSKKLPAS